METRQNILYLSNKNLLSVASNSGILIKQSCKNFNKVQMLQKFQTLIILLSSVQEVQLIENSFCRLSLKIEILFRFFVANTQTNIIQIPYHYNYDCNTYMILYLISKYIFVQLYANVLNCVKLILFQFIQYIKRLNISKSIYVI